MKIYQLLLVFLTICFVSCSEESSLVDLKQENVVTENNRETRSCAPEDLPCSKDIVSVLTGSISAGPNIEYGAVGVLDELLNCRNGIDDYCYRKCETTINLRTINGAVYFHSDCDGSVFPASEQLSMIQHFEQQAAIHAPSCDGVAMIPIAFDVYFESDFPSGYYAMVRYVSECSDQPTDNGGL